MDTFLIMFKNILVFVALAIPGFILAKKNVVDNKQSGTLSNILLYVGMPFLIISSTNKIVFTKDVIITLIITFICAICLYVLLFYLSKFCGGKTNDLKNKGVTRFCIVFSNCGFLGIPLVRAVFGDGLILTCSIIVNITMNIFMYSFGTNLISDKKQPINLKKIILSPLLISFIIAIAINLSKLNKNIAEINTFCDYLSNIVTPLSMMVIGIKLSEIKLGKLFNTKKMYYVSFMKLIAVPFLATLILYLLSLVVFIPKEVIYAIAIAFAMPNASLVCAFADMYNCDVENSVIYTLGTTLLSVITIPLLYSFVTLIV